MKTLKFAIAAFGLIANLSYAQDGDLSLPGEKWIASFKSFVCDDSGVAVSKPSSFESFNVEFERITTDRTLDNGLIKATFVEGASVCRYSAIMFADNAKQTIELVESKAYSLDGISACTEGKAMLDDVFEFNDYLYYGHPHNLAIMVPALGANSVCGGETVGVNFVVSGRIRN